MWNRNGNREKGIEKFHSGKNLRPRVTKFFARKRGEYGNLVCFVFLTTIINGYTIIGKDNLRGGKKCICRHQNFVNSFKVKFDIKTLYLEIRIKLNLI